ncbi:MAG: SsrA-binding protein SmpB [Verrucomicrobiae bacterium]|nr:SsrA-binding protein SmpB [Verrucomicrobiae bacterium]MCP5539055.1 SsrA-binding protein SmpB [Akkermansiaceae bacterium]MCP5551212.1 SsrA-binding protein SmpB [Akkermansiaceae bacterium]
MSEIATNRQARRDFHIGETWEAGVALKGTEVKSIRAGKVNLRDAFARIDHGEVWLHNCDIQPWESASHEQHEAKRPRKLLLHRREIDKMRAASEIKGSTLVALRLYWKNRRVKVEIGAGKGKVHQDRREDLKKRTVQREVDREMARFNRR